jgi:PqqD family protein of HPr-rel-A system
VTRSAPFAAFGFRFAITADDPALAALLDDLFALCRDEAPGDATRVHRLAVARVGGAATEHRLTLDGELLVATPDPALVLAHLVWQVNQHAVAAAGDRLALHAAGVARGGRAVLLSGASGAGKSTLTARLVADGFDYLGDEAVAIDPGSHAALPYPKPLTLEPASWPLLALQGPDPAVAPYQRAERQVAPRELRRDVGCAAAHPALVVVLDAGPAGASGALSRAEAVAALAEQSFNLGALGREGFATLVATISPCRCHRLARADLGAQRATIDAWLRAPAPPPATVAITTTPDDARGVRWRGGLEVACVDDEAVVFDPAADKVHHLNAPARAVWTALAGARTADDVARAVATEYRTDAGALRTDVADLLAAFDAEGLLAR